jgi:hypothetical protein
MAIKKWGEFYKEHVFKDNLTPEKELNSHSESVLSLWIQELEVGFHL